MQLTITIPADVVDAFRIWARAAGLDHESFALDCVLNQLETTARYRTLMGRQEQIDGALIALAELVGQIAEAAQGEKATDVCKFRPGSSIETAKAG